MDVYAISGSGSTQRAADVIFVHGREGDAFGTWRHGEDQTTSWPHWMGEEFHKVGVWSLAYQARLSRWSGLSRIVLRARSTDGTTMALPARSGQVLDLMAQRGIGQRPILFVCNFSLAELARVTQDEIAGRPCYGDAAILFGLAGLTNRQVRAQALATAPWEPLA